MRTTGNGVTLRAAILVVLLVLGAALALTLGVPGLPEVRARLSGAGPAVWTAMVLGVALVLLAPVPRSAVSVLVGAAAGFGPGVAVAFAGGLLAAVAAFGLSRMLGRSAAARLGGRRLDRVDELMSRRGLVAVLAGRLLPMVPFAVLSYGAGLTAIRWAPYLAGTALGLVPGTVLQVGVGASVSAVVDRGTPIAVLSSVGAVVVLTGLAAGAWRRRRRMVTTAASPV